MAEYCYVDNSNVFIEGQRVAAVKSHMSMNIHDAMRTGTLDNSYRIDFGKLHEFIAGTNKSEIKRAVLFGSRPPANDKIWDYARRKGFEVITEDRNVQNKEKKIDTGIVHLMTKDAYTKVDKSNDTITLVAGDGDFVPVIRDLVQEGFKVDVVFWSHASRELKDSCTKFIELDSHYELLKSSYAK
jgi:uncharacterized LabA/DUF88 family protein